MPNHLDVAVAGFCYLRVVSHQVACSDLIPAKKKRPLNILAVLYEGVNIFREGGGAYDPQLSRPIAVSPHVLFEILDFSLAYHFEFILKPI